MIIGIFAHIPGYGQGSCALPSVISSDLVLVDTCTYAASGTVTINAGVTLTISAGVVVLLPQGANIQVNGNLIANGTEANPVYLQNLNSQYNWGLISGSSSTIDLNHVNFVNANGGISAYYGTIILRNCSMDGMASGDAIAIHYASSVILENNEIKGVPGAGKVDAIDCDGITSGSIVGNHIYDFPDDAIDIGTGSENVQITDNYLHHCGSFGVSVGESSVATIMLNRITHCQAGGIQSHTGASVLADRNTLFGNGNAIECHHGTANSGGSAIVRNCIFANTRSTETDLQTGSVLQITYTLSNRESLDGEGNIFSEANFIDTINGNFHLQAYSPAINSGDPDNDGDGISFEADPDDQDPDGTRIDLGAEYYHHHPDLSYWTLRINEFSAINSSYICQETGSASDWIEIYNYGSGSVDLLGLNITDNLLIPDKWQIPSSLILEPGGYLILWADGYPGVGPDHLDFKLSGEGEQIGIYTPVSLQHIDSYIFSGQMENVSMGRAPTDSTQWVYFTMPTPDSANTGPTYTGITPPPFFSTPGGFFENPVTVSIDGSNPGDEIYYTLDKNDPTILSTAYSGAIQVSQTMIIRAIAVRENHLPSRPMSHIYFLNESYNLPVLAILTDPDNLFGETGIYSNPWSTGDDWEKFIQNQYFKDHQLRFSVNAGLRIQGGNSLNMPKKSFREFFESEYGSARLTYPLFPTSPVSSFKNIVLRSGYDDDITTGTGTLLRDPLSAELYRKSGALSTASDWAVLFLNDEYWGIYNLRESINEYFIEDHTGYTDFDLVRYQKYGAELKYGSLDDWNTLVQFIESANFSNQEEYLAVCEMVDMPNLINLLAFVHASQFRSWTWGSFAYKSKLYGSKWRWTIWDTDRAYTLLSWNGFTDYQYTYNEKWANFMPQAFLVNPGFRIDLINRTCDLLNTLFLPQNSIATFDSLVAIIDPEMPNEIQRWNPSLTNWETRKESIRNFLRDRPQVVRDQMRSYFSLSGQYSISLTVSGMGRIKINTLLPDTFPWQGIYMNNIPIELKAVPAPGYKFSGWDQPTLPDTFCVEITPSSDLSIMAFFEIDTASMNELPIILNEIMYNASPLYDSEDWVELYNPNQITMDLHGWILRDQNDSHQFSIPEGSIINAYGYMIVSRNQSKFRQVFPSVTNVVGDFGIGLYGFGLSSEGESLRLYNSLGNLVDLVNYGVTTPWPANANGTGPSIQLIDPGLDNNIGSNWIASPVDLFTPGMPNSASAISDNKGQNNDVFDFLIYPNPFRYQTTLQFKTSGPSTVSVQVYSLLGKKVDEMTIMIEHPGVNQVHWNPSGHHADLSSGTYFVRLAILGEQGFMTKTKQVFYLK